MDLWQNIVITMLGWLMVLLIFYVILFKVYYATEGDRPYWIWPAALVFLVIDVAVNLAVMPVLMIDFAPREWTVTTRMKRYKRITDTSNSLQWLRYHFADNLCLILNVFDKSDDGHC